jgi:hypothetical protein
MPPAPSPLVRTVLLLLAAGLIVVGLTLGYIAALALRRSEGVFMPAGCVALASLAGGLWLLRQGVRG